MFSFSAYPSEDPKIEGVQESYNVGDYVSANCTSGKSRPAAELTWHVNGVKVSQQADSWVWEYTIGYDDSDIQGLRTKTLGLHFQILNSHSGTSKLEIRCTAKVGASTRQTSVTPAIDRTMTSHKLHQERPNNAASE
ncbi:hypothetical protein C0J52_17315 [Blattella germanica]|nr:hypothetical protein C0J52_17315 [Blattella germanica]